MKPTGLVPADSVQGGWMWTDELYFANVVFLCCPAEDIPRRVREAVSDRDVVRELLGDDGFGKVNAHGGRFVGCHVNGAKVIAIWINAHAGSSTIAHEAFHAAFYVLNYAGLGLSESSEEAWAYYIGWLVRGMVNCVNGTTPPAPPRTPGFPDDPNAPASFAK